MRRADRLFQIVQVLRARRLTTARYLAERLEVSERTIYRDVQDLSLSGVPIMGEAGVGYALKKGYDLPPLMFDYDEVEALVLGARMLAAWGSTPLARAAHEALEKIAAVLPEPRRDAIEKTRIFVPSFHIDPKLSQTFEDVRRATRQKRVVEFDYRDEAGNETQRAIRPLGLYFWGERWTLAAWCELRKDFRVFRLDRVVNIRTVEREFVDEPGKRLEDFIRQEKEKFAADCENRQ
jgi:predicted DNA-binding transcriptional regulator YafY